MKRISTGVNFLLIQVHNTISTLFRQPASADMSFLSLNERKRATKKMKIPDYTNDGFWYPFVNT
jgi:hypothetical protein